MSQIFVFMAIVVGISKFYLSTFWNSSFCILVFQLFRLTKETSIDSIQHKKSNKEKDLDSFVNKTHIGTYILTQADENIKHY